MIGGGGALHMVHAVDLFEHLPHFTSGGMKATDEQLMHVAVAYLTYKAD